ncbi:MAG: trigger factor [Vampirovibrio sp.]|nr:trigger factor [Vampirovibrio sp.]
MKVEIDKKEKNLAQISLEVPADAASQEYNKACRRLAQRINVPGFRRGKAPRNIIEKNVGVDRIKQEAMDRLLPHVFADAISEHQLDIVAPPQIESYQFDLDKGLNVKALVELRPEVELPELAKIDVEVPQYLSPPDAEEKELQSIVTRMTTLEPVINRTVEKTDLVSIDFTGSVNGELIRGGSAKNYNLDIENNNFIEGFAGQLVGHNLSEEFTIKVTFPADYHDKAIAGKEADFNIKINEIKQKVVPELNDALAKKVANHYETLDQLKADIRKFLAENEEQMNDYRKQKAIIDDIVSRSTVEIPDSMTNREAKLLMEEVKQRFKEQGSSWDQYLDAQGHEAIWENLRNEANQRIKTSLVFGAIAKKENVSVTEDEFQGQVKEMAEMRQTDEKSIMRQLASNMEWVQAVNDRILTQKVVEMLTERATVKFVEDTGKDAEEGGTTAPKEAVAAAPAGLQGEEFEVLAEE